MTSTGLVVVPGQYLAPTYKYIDEHHTAKYVAGRGTAVATVDAQGQPISVVAATIWGKVVVAEAPAAVTAAPAAAAAAAPAAAQLTSAQTYVVLVVPKLNAYLEFDRDYTAVAPPAHSISINLPHEGDVVLVRITKINPRQAFAEILLVEAHGNVLRDGGLGANGEGAHRLTGAGGGAPNLSLHTAIALLQLTAVAAQAADLGESFKGVIRAQDVRLTERDKVKVLDCFRPGDIVRAAVILLGDGSNYYLSTARDDLGVVFAKSDGGLGELMYATDWQHMATRSGVVERRKCAKPFA